MTRQILILKLCAFVFMITLIMPGAASSQGFLHTSGTRIVDGNGSEVIFHGMGLGGWLLPEGYMLYTSSFADSPSKLRSTFAALIGETNTDQFFRTYRANFMTKRDVDSLAHWGYNEIRLAMNYSLLTPRDTPGVYLESGFALIDSLLSWCESDHIFLILDLHAAPGGQNPAGHSDYDPAYPSLWDSVLNRSRTVDLWGKLAQRYASRRWIAGYDLLNEPAWDLGSGNVPLRNLYVDITNAIRAVDTNHIIFVEGNWWATDFAGLTPPWDNNMVYSFHKYWNGTEVSTIQYLLDLRVASNVPLWLGESGENSNQWFAETIAMLENNRIGWSWWTHKKFETITGPVSATRPADYNTLLNYWNGQGPKPTVDFAVQALNEMAESLKMEHCVIRRDVIDAERRQPYSDATIPFVHSSVPGTLFASDYDLGKNGFAYSDIDYKNTDGGTDWNSGWQYRNDGVDIEVNMDFPSNGYSVGWINTGEYLNVTATVEQTGTYSVDLRASANATGGKVILKCDGVTISPAVSIPLSGGWQNWETVNLGQFPLSAGKHTFGLYFYFGGFNVNYLDFALVPSAVAEESQAPREFRLEQNYPNPFNPKTVVDYQLPEVSDVRLVVYDILGREVAVLMSGQQEAGRYHINFDASALASGVYVYRLKARPVGGEQGRERLQTRTMVLMK